MLSTSPLPPPPAAAEVLAALSERYTRFHDRNRAYVRLLSFLAFVTLFMAVLFMQRSAGSSYEVCSRHIWASTRVWTAGSSLLITPPSHLHASYLARCQTVCCLQMASPLPLTSMHGSMACFSRAGWTLFVVMASVRHPLSLQRLGVLAAVPTAGVWKTSKT